MIKPPEIDDISWDVISAAASGDVGAMRRLLAEDPKRSCAGYFYTPAIHFAVREGHAEIVQMLLDAGADVEWNGHYGMSLSDMAQERGHERVAEILIQRRDSRGRTAAAESHQDHAIHTAAQAGDLQRVRELLDRDPSLISIGDHAGGTPLHRAVVGSARNVVELLLDRGADIHAIHGAGLGSSSGFSPATFRLSISQSGAASAEDRGRLCGRSRLCARGTSFGNDGRSAARDPAMSPWRVC